LKIFVASIRNCIDLDSVILIDLLTAESNCHWPGSSNVF
jgi:hypothetical protein